MNRNQINLTGKEIIDIHPIILGGHPTDASNKSAITREQHFKYVVYWNREIRKLRTQSRGTNILQQFGEADS